MKKTLDQVGAGNLVTLLLITVGCREKCWKRNNFGKCLIGFLLFGSWRKSHYCCNGYVGTLLLQSVPFNGFLVWCLSFYTLLTASTLPFSQEMPSRWKPFVSNVPSFFPFFFFKGCLLVLRILLFSLTPYRVSILCNTDTEIDFLGKFWSNLHEISEWL